MSEWLRPLYHFAPARNWINDPNGLIWLDGEYHLFFQHNPHGDVWGHMSWGHAVSVDLVHWRELPLAIAEDPDYMIFSGSVVLDAANSAGFAANGEAALVAIYTGAAQAPRERQNQQLAYSLDRGRTWTKYAGNPVLDIGVPDFRDPKVFWHAAGARWVMVVVRSDLRQACFYGSTDLKSWQPLGDFGPTHAGDGIWECPDLIPLALAADGAEPARTVWMLKVDVFGNHVAGSSGARVYFGTFDGARFECAPDAWQWVDWGMDFYACASWGNLPALPPGAPLAAQAWWIGWLDNHGYARLLPTAPWRGQMSIPRALSLRRIEGRVALIQQPPDSLAALRRTLLRAGPLALAAGAWRALLPATTDELRASAPSPAARLRAPAPSPAAELRALDIELELAPGSHGSCGLALRAGEGGHTLLGYDADTGRIFLDRSASGFRPEHPAYAGRRSAPCRRDGQGRVQLRALLDSCSLELLSEDGSVWISERIVPQPDDLGIAAWADGAAAMLTRIAIHALVP